MSNLDAKTIQNPLLVSKLLLLGGTCQQTFVDLAYLTLLSLPPSSRFLVTQPQPGEKRPPVAADESPK